MSRSTEIMYKDTHSDGDAALICLSESDMRYNSGWRHDGLTCPLLRLNDTFANNTPEDVGVYTSHIEVGDEAPRLSLRRLNGWLYVWHWRGGLFVWLWGRGIE